jgi:Ca2+:H+ antiporter
MSSGTGNRITRRPVGFFRAELTLFLSLTTVAILLWIGTPPLENLTSQLWLTLVLLWLFAVVLWSAMSVAHHADCLALKFGEPYGTLILTLAAITIEVIMISAAVLHGANNPSLARDTMFAVIMIALNGLIGVSLLLGGLRHREQHYNLQGTNSYLNAIITLAVLPLRNLPGYPDRATSSAFR